MPFITPDNIRDISVKTVEGFLNNKIPLSEGLAKQASALQLNSEQIQRAIEATNSIAYLKILSLSNDRTVEFPLCKYAEVMGVISLPQLSGMLDKGADHKGISEEKSINLDTFPELLEAEKKASFVKFASINKAELESLRDREFTIIPELHKAAAAIGKDAQGLEKLATVLEGKDFTMATVLVYGEPKPYADTGIFKSAELKDANSLAGLIKEARELVTQINEKQDLFNRSELLKQAFVGAAGIGIGKVLGGALGAPIKALGAAASRTAHNVGNSALNVARSAVGMPLLNTPIKRFGLGAGLATAGTIGLDASLYSPGKDSTTGRSKDVWTALQREPD